MTELPKLRKLLAEIKTERDEARNASEAAHVAQGSLRDEITVLRRQLSIAFEMLENVCGQISVIEASDAMREEETSLRDDLVKFRRAVLDEFAFLKEEAPKAEGLDGFIEELTDGLLAERF